MISITNSIYDKIKFTHNTDHKKCVILYNFIYTYLYLFNKKTKFFCEKYKFTIGYQLQLDHDLNYMNYHHNYEDKHGKQKH